MLTQITISLCMIVKDEEQVIARCLDSVQHIVDEIVIVDTGSTDKTKDIVRKYTANIYDYKWNDNFAAARNFSFSKAKKDYILWLDADDVLFEKEQQKLLKLKQEIDPDIDAISMFYHLGVGLDGKPLYIATRHRLVKRSRNFQWTNKVHEVIQAKGNTLHSDIVITHCKERPRIGQNFKILQSIVEGGEATNIDRFNYANECMFRKNYEEAIQQYKNVVESKEGWEEEYIYVYGNLGYCYAELQEWDKAIEAYMRTFQYGTPRGEMCVGIGDAMMAQQKYKEAIRWYLAATRITCPTEALLCNPAGYTWVPYFQLSLCYSHLADYGKACHYNELAAKYIPDHPAVVYNRQYFNTVLQSKE
ncbi:glycosyltransferase [Bacillus mycoides]|nr:glycosyltransferase [Bacillus mycoides]